MFALLRFGLALRPSSLAVCLGYFYIAVIGHCGQEKLQKSLFGTQFQRG